jgi:hypothetical protein
VRAGLSVDHQERGRTFGVKREPFNRQNWKRRV